MNKIKRIDSSSMKLSEENVNQLKQLFPEVFAEGKIDFEVLRELLGDLVEDKQERYSFNWNGKTQARRLAQQSSTGTLRPANEYFVQNTTHTHTDNLYIEGDNLEVLKLLQKSYHSKIKMIYIDPPYNTGKDFVYKDNFKDNMKNYLEMTGQTGEDGQRLSTNSETSGRYHSDWLNMMYPRLKLARNLLRDDGVIFISIDDNEEKNLTNLCNELLGESNKLGKISIINNLKGRSDDKFFATCHEYLLVYAKNIENIEISGIEITEEEVNKDYGFKDEIGMYKLIGLRKTGKGWQRKERPKMYYPILKKDNQYSTIEKEEFKKIYHNEMFNDKYVEELCEKYKKLGYEVFLPHSSTGEKGRWRWGRENFLKQQNSNLDVNEKNTLCSKMRATLENGEIREKGRKTLWYQPEYDTGSASKILKNIFSQNIDVFDNPKSIIYLKDIINTAKLGNDDIILDFFSGSATTAHAVMQLNAEDGGSRKFIMVQLPEACDEKSEAFKAGYKNICEIGKERIIRAGKKIKEDESLPKENREKLDIDFKVFKLDSSNIKEWDSETENLRESLFDSVDNIKEDRTSLDVLYEILLKYGLDLNVAIEDKKDFYSIGGGTLLVNLNKEISLKEIETICEEYKKLLEIDEEFKTVVVLRDTAFKNDVDKTNAIQRLKQVGIAEIRSI